MVIGSFSYAQQIELLDTTWYLEKLVIDNEEFFPPNNEEVTPDQITAYFMQNFFYASSGCNEMSGGIVFDDEILIILRIK